MIYQNKISDPIKNVLYLRTQNSDYGEDPYLKFENGKYVLKGVPVFRTSVADEIDIKSSPFMDIDTGKELTD